MTAMIYFAVNLTEDCDAGSAGETVQIIEIEPDLHWGEHLAGAVRVRAQRYAHLPHKIVEIEAADAEAQPDKILPYWPEPQEVADEPSA